jgi:hypothetical protein
MRTSSTIQIGEVHLYEKSFNSLSHNQNVSITWVQYIGLLCPAKKPNKSAKLSEYIQKQY